MANPQVLMLSSHGSFSRWPSELCITYPYRTREPPSGRTAPLTATPKNNDIKPEIEDQISILIKVP